MLFNKGNHLGADFTGFSFISLDRFWPRPASSAGTALKKTIAQVLLLAGLCTAISAQAYNEGGHYYTLLALFDSHAKATPENRLREMKLQALCSELPDMAQEFDAISQRIRVLQSLKDNLWGLLGQCQTTVSSHMVASQYYLHALSGAPADRIRSAAGAIIKAIDDDLARLGATQSQERRNLICARGLAAHLYGDAFAHVRLSSEKPSIFSSTIKTEMYKTGLAHARDGRAPDYLYGHNIDIDKWPQWVKDAATNIAAGSDPAQTLYSHQPCQDKIATCEEPARLRLQKLVTMRDKLMVPDMQQRIASGSTGIGGMERATKCNDVLNSVYPDANDRPQCDIAWKNYLERAIPIFYDLGIDPTSRSNAGAGRSCSAWRCAGSKSYRGEAPGSCTVEVNDELRFGSE